MDRHYLSRCPACGSANVSKKFTAVDYTATGETFDVFECAACGMRFTQNAPLEQNAGKYYHSPDYISHSDTRKGIVNRIYHYVRSVMLRRKAKLVADVLGKTEGKLLDIGAGTGYFANEMKRAGFYVNAVEIDPGARKFALEHFGVTEEDISALDKFPDENFDVARNGTRLPAVGRVAEVAPSAQKQRAADYCRAQLCKCRCKPLQGNVGCLRCAAPPVAFQSSHHASRGATTRFQTRCHAPDAL